MKIYKFQDHFEIEEAVSTMHGLQDIFLEIEDEFKVESYYEFHQAEFKTGSQKMFKVYFPDGSSGHGFHGGHISVYPKSYFRIFFVPQGENMQHNTKEYLLLCRKINDICKLLDRKINREIEFHIDYNTKRGSIGFVGPNRVWLPIDDDKKDGIEVILYLE